MSLSALSQTPPLLRSTPSNLEGDVHGAVHTISTTPPDLPYRRGGVLGGAITHSDHSRHSGLNVLKALNAPNFEF